MRFLFACGFLLQLLLACQAASISKNSAISQNDYLITMPKVFTNSEEQICLTWLNKETLPLQKNLQVQIRDIKGEQVFFDKNMPITTEVNCAKIAINKIEAQFAKVHVKVATNAEDKEPKVDEQLDITVKQPVNLVIIESSKPLYQPGEKLQFRVFTLDSELKPVEQRLSKVVVQNTHGLTVQEWQQVKTNQGLVELSLPLAAETVVGNWKIIVFTENEQELSKTIEVNNQVLPPFSIEMNQPKYVVADAEKIKFQICAFDQDKMPIEGQMNITVGYKPFVHEHSETVFSVNVPTKKMNKTISGCAEIEMQTAELNLNKVQGRMLIVEAEIEEHESHIKQHLIQELPVSSTEVIFSLPTSRIGKQYFKPQIPFKGFFFVERPDLKKMVDTQVKVCFESREQPWNVTKENEHCKEYKTNQDGMVIYEIPAQSEKVKQLFVTVSVPQYQHVEKSFIVHPWFESRQINEAKLNQTTTETTTTENKDQVEAEKLLQLFIEPAIERTDCNAQHKIKLTTFNLNKPVQAFVQVIGNKMEAPKAIRLDPAQGKKIAERTHQFEFTVESAQLKSKALPSARVLVFTWQPETGLTADYDSFAINCRQSELAAKVQWNKIKQVTPEQQQFQIPVEFQRQADDARCVYTLSKDQTQFQLAQKKLNRFMEKLDAGVEIFIRERCQRERQLPMTSYRSAFHAFERAGVRAVSRQSLDVAPCDDELYPNGPATDLQEYIDQTLPNLLQQRNYLLNEQTEVAKLERRAQDKYISWPVKSELFVEPFQTPEVHLSAICLSRKNGIAYVHAEYTQQQAGQPITARIAGPQQMKSGERATFQLKLQQQYNQQKNQQKQCRSIAITMKSEKLEIASTEQQTLKQFCFCEEQTTVYFNATASHEGKHNVQVQIVATDAASNCQVTDRAEKKFAPITVYSQVRVQPAKVNEVRNYEYQVICNEKNTPVEVRAFESPIAEKVKVEDMRVSTNLLEVLMPNQKSQEHQIHQLPSDQLQYKSPLELVSYMAALVYANRTEAEDMLKNNPTVYEQKQHQLKQELHRVHQMLDSKRLPDGFYSWFVGKSAARPFVDLPLTSFIFKLYRQPELRHNLPHDQKYLRQTLMSLLRQQKPSGAISMAPYQPISRRPELNETEQSAYTLVQFAEAGLRSNGPMVRRLINYLRANPSQISHAALAYTYALEGEKTESEQFIAKFVKPEQLMTLIEEQNKSEQNIFINATSRRVIISMQALALHAAGHQTEAAQLAKHLTQAKPNQETLFEDPIEAQLWTQVWKQLRSSLKVQETKQSETERKYTIQGVGCALMRLREVISIKDAQQKQFKLTVHGVERGFRSCAQRSLRVCYRAKQAERIFHTPMLNIELPTGYLIDEWLLTDLLNYGPASQVDSFELRGQQVHLLLKPLLPSQSHCIELPLLQRHQVDKRAQYQVQMFDYEQLQKVDAQHSHPLDTVFYELPVECEISQRSLFSIRPANQQESSVIRRVRRATSAQTEEEKKTQSTDEAKPEEQKKRNTQYNQQSYGGQQKSQSYGGYEQKSYETPKYEQPKYEQKSYEQPKYEQKSYEQPKYEQPKYEQKSYSQPKYEAPKSYEMPKASYGYSQPEQQSYQSYQPEQKYETSYQQTSYQQPKASYGGYQAETPKYEQPKYEQKSYSQPKYETPKSSYGYEKPQSYEQPKYETPSYGYQVEQPKYETSYQQPKYETSYQQPKASYGGYQAAAPKYEQPKYEQPKYEQKSYSQPKYEAPKSYEMPKASYGYNQPEQQSYQSYQPEQKYETSYQQTSYQQPKASYGGYQAETPKASYGYEAQTYSEPEQSYQPQSYQQQSYQPQSYQQQSYQPQSYQQQSYQQPEQQSYQQSYQQPEQQSYQQQSYQQEEPKYQDYQQTSYSSYKRSAGGDYSGGYYNGGGYSNGGYNGAQYKPAPIVIAPSYQPVAYGGYSSRSAGYGGNSYAAPSYSGSYGSAGYGSSGSGYGSAAPSYNSGYGSTGYGSAGYGSGNSGYGSAGYGSAGYGSGNSGYGSAGYGSSNSGYGSAGYGSAGYGSSGSGYNSGYGSTGYGSSGSGYGSAAPSYNSGYGSAGYGSGNSGYGSAGYGSSGSGYGSAAPSYNSGYGSTGYGSSGSGYGSAAPSYSGSYGSAGYGSSGSGYGSAAPSYNSGYGSTGYGSSGSGYGSAAPSYNSGYGSAGYGSAGYGSDSGSSYDGGYGSSSPSYGGEGYQSNSYSVLYAPAKSYGNSYGSYAASSEEKASVAKLPKSENCKSESIKGCPACNNDLPMDLISNMCLYEEAHVQVSDQHVSNDAQTTCAKTKMYQVIGQSKLPITNIAMSSQCSCPQLSGKSIVFYKQSQVSGNKVVLGEESHIVKLTSGLISDLRQLKAQCTTSD